MSNSVLKKVWKILWPVQIKYRLIIAIGLVHFICMLLFVFYRLYQQDIFLQQQSFEQVTGMAETLASNANAYFESSNWDGLQRLVQSQKNFQHLKYVMILSEDNKVLAHTQSSFIGTSPIDSVSNQIKHASQNTLLVDNHSLLDIAVPVFNLKKEITGWVRIAISRQYISDNLVKLAKSGIISILISFLLISVTVILLITKLVNEFYKLIGVADQIKSGDRTIRAAGMKSFETTKVGMAFNQMLDSIDEHEMLLATVLENLPVGVCLLNEKGEEFFCNKESKKIWSGESVISDNDYHTIKRLHLQSGLHPAVKGIAGVLQNGQMIVKEEIAIECLDKSNKIIQHITIPLIHKSDSIIGAITIEEDITEEKKKERDLIQRNYSLEQFSYVLSHNVRGPLSNILGAKAALELPLGTAERMQLIDSISISAEKMDMVIKDLNSILQVRNSSFIEQENISLYDLIQEIMEDLSYLITEKKATVEADFSLATHYFSVKPYLKDIFYNLVSNALKFSKKNTPPEIKIWSEVKNDFIYFHFKDFGLGLDLKRYENELFRLYKKFHIGFAGKGMGLFMVKTQVDLLEGRITVDSKPDEWTEFVVGLPEKDTHL